MRRETQEVKSGRRRRETACGVASLTHKAASPERLLSLNRGQWTVKETYHILDWSFDEDRSHNRSGHGPENMTLLRRFAIGLIKGRWLAVAEIMRNLARNPRRVLDFQKMTDIVGAARPRRPAILSVQATPVHLVAEFRLLLALILGFVERLEEEQPSELLDVVPWSHTVGVELVAGVLHGLLDLLTPVPDAVVVRFGHSLASLTPPSERTAAASPPPDPT